MKGLAALFLACQAFAAGQKSVPVIPAAGIPAVKTGAGAVDLPPVSVDALKVIPLPIVLPGAPMAAPPLVAVPAAAPQAPLTAAQSLQNAAQFAAPGTPGGGDGSGFGGVFDGAPPQDGPFRFSALPVAAQLDASRLYRQPPTLIPWTKAKDGQGWLKFYAGLYKALKESGPKAYRQETPRGPVFHLGGHDVAQAILGVGRAIKDGEVNLLAQVKGPEEILETWARLDVDAGALGRYEVAVNPESTASLEKMAARPASPFALDRAPNNIFLKWNLVTLTPEGLEIRAMDARTSADIRNRVLRLSTNTGLLGGYSAHYNLIVAYRAMRETAHPWSFDPATRRLFARSLARMPQAELEEALSRAADNPALKGDGPPTQGMRRLVAFIQKEIGFEAGRRARQVSLDMPASRGGFMEDGVPRDLIEAAAPYRTQVQLQKLAAAKPAVEGRARFAVIGDAEPGRFWWSRLLFNIPGVFERLMRRADKEGADFIMQLGDLVSVGTVKNYRRFFGGLAAIRPLTPFLTVLGNHDRAKPHGVTNSRVYRTLFGAETDYVFERGGARFIVLDSSTGRVADSQLDWLERQLKFDGPKVLFTHMPPGYLGEWTDVPGYKGVGGFNAGAARFRELVEKARVDRVYVGHIHAFDALEKNGVRYVLTGGGGSALFPLLRLERKFHHYLVVEVDALGAVSEVVRSDDGSSYSLEWRR